MHRLLYGNILLQFLFLFLFGSESVIVCEKKNEIISLLKDPWLILFAEILTCNMLKAKFQFSSDSEKEIDFNLISIF